MENFEDAVHDLNVALSLEDSLSKKNRIIDELETLLNHCKRSNGTNNSHSKDDENNLGSFGIFLRSKNLTFFSPFSPSCVLLENIPVFYFLETQFGI